MTSLIKLLRHFRSQEGGNIIAIFTAASIPLLLIMGGAVDLTRYTRYKTALANAVDAAGLALASDHFDATEAQATLFVTDYVEAFELGDNDFTVDSIAVSTIDNGFHIAALGSMQTMFLPLGMFAKDGQEMSALDVSIVVDVVNASNRLELALVVDNTGSMNCAASLSTSCVNNWSAPAANSASNR